MRKENSIKNSISSVISNVITMLVSFIAQAIFIKILGTEYLGLNGLYTNILTILSCFELGIGSAIVYHLYKPLAKNEKKTIKELMNFYKKTYRIISAFVLFIGIMIIPFLGKIVGKITIDINIYIIYIMYLINTSTSYLLSYKKNILQANQKSYILNVVHIMYVIMLNAVQIIILIITHNYYMYLVIKFFFQTLENIVDSVIATKMYPFLKDLKGYRISKCLEKDIFKKVKALFLHKIGSSVVNGTDNIIISFFLGVSTVGFYSNYYTIINTVSVLCKQIISATTASVGNLLITSDDNNKKFEIFDKMRFFNFVLSCLCSICLLVLITPFITIWIGENYVLGLSVTITLIFNFFQKNQRSVYQTFKDSAGIWHEDRFVPLIESIMNIVVSIIFLKFIGLAGVFIGTIVSGLVLWCYSYPKYVYKSIFKRKYTDYAKETLSYILVFVFLAFITFYICSLIKINNIYIKFLINCLICCTVPEMLIYLIYRKDEKMRYFFSFLKKNNKDS